MHAAPLYCFFFSHFLRSNWSSQYLSETFRGRSNNAYAFVLLFPSMLSSLNVNQSINRFAFLTFIGFNVQAVKINQIPEVLIIIFHRISG